MTTNESTSNTINPLIVGSFGQYMEHAPTAVAVTRGPRHVLVYANLAFSHLTAVGSRDYDQPVVDVVRGWDASALSAVLDRVFRTGVSARETSLAADGTGAPNWYCAVWPHQDSDNKVEHLVIELGESSQAELTLALQREVAERMLLSALREHEATNAAQQSNRRATFLAIEGRRLSESLDEATTQEAVTRLVLPSLAAWCIVDVVDHDNVMRRLRIVHPDERKQVALRELEGRWFPEPGDVFGLPAMLRSRAPLLITSEQIDAALVAGAHDEDILTALRALGIGAFLTVPLVIRDALLGAVTFVSDTRDRKFSDEDIALAEELAVRSAIALDSARLHGDALTLKVVAETASRAKTNFLGTMSHELRTPLNAIGGYVDLMLMGLRGPVSEAQEVDLSRIKRNQRHLLGLITDLLNFVRVESGGVSYVAADVIIHDAIESAIGLVDALIVQKGLICDFGDVNTRTVAHADWDKVQQILINLLSNAIKFTDQGGRVTIQCETTDDTVIVEVADTGIGIPLDKFEVIFDPFVQVKEGFAGRDSGIGLGLAISRDLARGMGGDLRVESKLGRGSTFRLTLPRAVVTG